MHFNVFFFKTDIKQYETWNQDPVTKVSGLQINAIQAQNFKPNGKKFLSKVETFRNYKSPSSYKIAAIKQTPNIAPTPM